MKVLFHCSGKARLPTPERGDGGQACFAQLSRASSATTIIAVLTICFFADVTFADPVKDRLDVLEKTLQTIQNDSVKRNENVASSLATIDQIKQEYQAVQGTMEANSQMIKVQQAELLRLKRDMTARISAMEERMQIYDVQITKAVAKIFPAAANEAEGYQKGLDLVQKGDFLTAVASFRTFLKAYHKSEFAGNAQYWIGECYFALKDYPKAIKEYQVLVDKYPRSGKLAGAILKQGISFADMGMIDDAKVFLNKVIKDYNGTDESARAREKLDKMAQRSAVPTPPSDSTSLIPLAPGVATQPANTYVNPSH